MSGNDKKPPRGKSWLSEDDAALWDLVSSRVAPVRGKHRVGDVEPPPPGRARKPASASSGERVTPAAASKPVPKPMPQRAPAPSRSLPPPQPVTLERRKARRLARGSEEIEARLDLHGMTQADAHATLAHFVRRCHAEGLRNVLVITGKGGAGRGEDDDALLPARPRGVLRRNVPRWLAAPDLAPMVVSYATAHIRHGGEGALYLRLRRGR